MKRGQLLLDTGKDIYWDWKDPDLRRGMVQNSRTALNLGRFLTDIERRLQAEPGFTKKSRSHYEPSELNRRNIASAALSMPGSSFLNSLLFVEAQVVRTALRAGLAMAEFNRQKAQKPSLAVQALARFGSGISPRPSTRS